MSDPHPEQPAHDSHGHGGDALGAIDFTMWGVGVLGVALGLLVALCCAFAVGML
jgi:hypothetical protein